MAKTQDVVLEKWGKLSDLQQQLLQILATLSNKGAEIAVVEAAAAALRGEVPEEGALGGAWRKLDADAKVWFVKNPTETRRKLRAAARDTLPAMLEETPGWSPLWHDRVFDALALLASDEIFEVAVRCQHREKIRGSNVFRQLEALHPRLQGLRAAEAEALLAVQNGLVDKKAEHKEWNARFAERVGGAPLPQTPLLFLGVRPGVLPPNEFNVFAFLPRLNQHVWTDLSPEPWDAEKAARLAEYMTQEAPGETASAYQILVLEALAARLVYEEADDLEEAARRLGNYGALLDELPELPPAGPGGSRRGVLREDFIPLAFSLEDSREEIGPATELRRSAPERSLSRQIEESDIFFGNDSLPPEMLDMAREILASQLNEAPETDLLKKSETPQLPVYRGGTGPQAVARARAAYPEILKKLKKECDPETLNDIEGYLAELEEAGDGDALHQWLENGNAEAAELAENHMLREQQYLLLSADAELAKRGVALDDLSEPAAEQALKLRLAAAAIEMKAGELAHAFLLAAGFAEAAGAESERAWQIAQRELALFFKGNGYPGRAAVRLRRWLDWAEEQPASRELLPAKIETVVEYLENLSELGRYAVALRVCQDMLLEIVFEALGNIEEFTDLVYCWGCYSSWLSQSVSLGVLPDYAPVLEAFEKRLAEIDGSDWTFIVPPLRLITYLTLRPVTADGPARVYDGLISAYRFLREDLPRAVGEEKLRSRKVAFEEEPLIVFAMSLFSLPAEHIVMLTPAYELDVVLAACCAYEIEMAVYLSDDYFPNVVRETSEVRREQTPEMVAALQNAKHNYKNGFKKITQALDAIEEARTRQLYSGDLLGGDF